MNGSSVRTSSSTSSPSRREAGPFSAAIVRSASEDPQERHPGASAPRDGEVVVADLVVHRPARERQRRRREARGDPGEPPAPGSDRQQRHEHRREQHLVRGPDQHQHRDAGAERDEAAGGGPSSARARTSAHSASPVAKTASLDAWW